MFKRFFFIWLLVFGLHHAHFGDFLFSVGAGNSPLNLNESFHLNVTLGADFLI